MSRYRFREGPTVGNVRPACPPGSNVRPAGRISAHTVLGILELADRAKSLPIAKVGEADRRTFNGPGLRYPQDFPGAHPRVQASEQDDGKETMFDIRELGYGGCLRLIDDEPAKEPSIPAATVDEDDEAFEDLHSPFVSDPECAVCELLAKRVEAPTTGEMLNWLDDAKAIQDAAFAGVAAPSEEQEKLLEAVRQLTTSSEIKFPEFKIQVLDFKGVDCPLEDAPQPARPVGNAAKTLVVLPSRQMGKTAAQDRLARLPLVTPGKAGGYALPPCPIEARRQRLTRAIEWLKTERGMGVRIVDRQAEIRHYQVGGYGTHMLADAVIDFAIEAGMPVDG